MGAGAPKYNTNAEKWTYELSEKLLLDAITLSNSKKEFTLQGGVKVEGYEFDFIGEIARELNTYHQNITRDIANRHTTLKPLINKLLSNLEANCYSNTKKGIIKEATGIVNLKSNHKWTDRLENNQNINDQRKTVNDLFPDLSESD